MTWYVLAAVLLFYAVYRITKHFAYREGFNAGEQTGLRASRSMSELLGYAKGWTAGYQQGRHEKIIKGENEPLQALSRLIAEGAKQQ